MQLTTRAVLAVVATGVVLSVLSGCGMSEARKFAHARRANFPPGRGFLIEGGKLTGVHVALPAQS